MTVDDATARDQPDTAVFLSYSREDATFCARLADALEAAGYAAIYDRSDNPPVDPDLRLTPQDEWWAAIRGMIAASDVMVFIVSPDSAASPACDNEIDHARSLGKRVITILYRDVDLDLAPEGLRRLNVQLDFRVDGPTFEEAMVSLLAELKLDINWHRRGTRFTRLAQQWADDGHPDNQLLRAGAIADFDAWVARRPVYAPALGQLVLDFLEDSRRRELADSLDRRRIVGRAFVKPAQQELREGRPYAALRWSAAGMLLAGDHALDLVPELIPGIRDAVRALQGSSARTMLWGHEASVMIAAFSPDGKTVLTAATDGAVLLWEAGSGRRMFQLSSAGYLANLAIFSPDGAYVATAADWPPRALLWSSVTGTLVAEFEKEHVRDILCMCFSPDSSKLAIAYHDHSARVWSVETGEELSCFMHDNSVYTVSFSPDGATVVSGSHDLSARVWSASTGKQIAKLGNNFEQFAAYSASGTRILSTSYGGPPRLWETSNYKELAVLEHDHPATTCFSFSSNGDFVACAYEDNSVIVWNSATGKSLAQCCGHQDSINSIRFSPDDGRIVTASDDRTARVWDAVTGEELLSLIGHQAEVHSANFSPCGTQVVTASADATARTWDSSKGEIAILRGHSGWVNAAAFSADNSRIVSVSHLEGTGRIWDAATGRQIGTLQAQGEVRSVVFSPDETNILCAWGRGARIFDSVSGSVVCELAGHEDRVATARYSHDGKMVVTASADRTARLWDAYSGIELLCLRGHLDQVQDAAISPDGAKIATCSGPFMAKGSDYSARIWDAANGRQLALMLGHGDGVNSLGLSPDGARLVTASEDGTARIWDVASGRELHCLSGHDEHRVNVARFSPDGKLVVTGASNATVRLWDSSNGREIRCLEGHQRWISDAMISADGARVFTASHDVTARIWDISSGMEITRFVAHRGRPQTAFFAFSGDGACLLTQSDDGVLSLWDVARTAALAGSPVEVLAASLSDGGRTRAECEDLLMGEAHEVLRAALLDRLSDAERENVIRRMEFLRKPLHPHCYVPPSRR